MRLPPHDCSGAYRCYRVSKLREARLDQVVSRGYSFQQEVLYRCRKAGCRLGEAVRSLSVLAFLGVHAFFGLD